MYKKDFYEEINKEKIFEDIKDDGFTPMKISDSPGYIYKPHKHSEDKLLVFLRGKMDLKVEGEEFECTPGDKVLIPKGSMHSAVVGEDGCEFFWCS